MLTPDLVCDLDDAGELGPLLVLGERVAFLGRGETALAGDAELVEIGERRRLVLARCLLPKPALVVADEPTAGLDSSLKSELLDTMLAARRERMSYVFISHELDVVRYVADRVLVLVEGRVVEELPGAYLDPTREDTSLHPYTEHLLASSFQAPRRLPAVKRRVALPAGGCIYLRRCHRADPEHPSYDRCVAESPSLQTQSSGRRVACHRVQSPASEGS